MAPPCGREDGCGRGLRGSSTGPRRSTYCAPTGSSSWLPSLWRERGRMVPPELADEVRLAATTTVAAPVLLSRAQAAYHGRLMLMKGLEVAERYPYPASRSFTDLDLLAEEPDAAQARPDRRRLRRASDRPRLLRRTASRPAGVAGGSSRRRAPSAPKLPALSEAAAARRTVGDGRSE